MCPATHAVLSHPQVMQTLSLNNTHQINHLTVGFPPAFIHSAATAAGDKRHDAHRLSSPSKPNPEKPCSNVAHLDPQHRLDGPALCLAGHSFRARGRRLRGHPLAFRDLRPSAQICGELFSLIRVHSRRSRLSSSISIFRMKHEGFPALLLFLSKPCLSVAI